MDHIMQLDQQHHNLEVQCDQDTAMASTSSTSVSVSQVAFALAAIAFLSLFSSFAMAMRASPLPSALSAEILAALCSFVMTKKVLFLLSNVIFLFLAADCRCFLGICSMSLSSTSDYVVTASELPPIGVLAKQARHHQEEMARCAVPTCVPCSGSLYHNNSNIAPENCSEDQGKQHEVPVSSASQPELFGLEEEEENSVTFEMVVVKEPTCGTADQELEQLEIDELNRKFEEFNREIDELNRKFEEFIRSRKIKWIEEEEALQCRQV